MTSRCHVTANGSARSIVARRRRPPRCSASLVSAAPRGWPTRAARLHSRRVARPPAISPTATRRARPARRRHPPMRASSASRTNPVKVTIDTKYDGGDFDSLPLGPSRPDGPTIARQGDGRGCRQQEEHKKQQCRRCWRRVEALQKPNRPRIPARHVHLSGHPIDAGRVLDRGILQRARCRSRCSRQAA